MITPDHEFLTVKEAAELLRVSVPTIRRWIASGRLPGVRLGARTLRVRRSSLARARRGVERTKPAASRDEDRARAERVAAVEKLIAELNVVNDAILKRRGGKPLPSSLPLIHQARRARVRQL
jgi:excisionase family DNA binding protein